MNSLFQEFLLRLNSKLFLTKAQSWHKVILVLIQLLL